MHVAVVGGGVSGAVAAYRLRAALGDGATITLFEAGDTLGGKLRTAEVAGVRYDVGAEAFLARRPEGAALAADLGLGLVHPTGARSTVRAGGRLTPLPGGTLMGIPGSPDAVADVLSPGARARVAAEADLPPVTLDDDVALGALLRERFGDELVDRLVDPLLGGVYAGGADGLGLRATVPALAAALDRGATSLTAAAAGLIPAEPSTAPVFGTLPGGLGTLVDTLVEQAKPDVRLGQPVTALRRRETGWQLEAGTEAVDVDAVLLAVPAPAARRLLGDVVPAASAALGEVELASMAVVAMALPPGTELPDASGVLIGARERRSDGEPFAAKAFTFSSRKWAHLDTGPVLVRGSVGRFGEPGALHRDDEDLVRLVRADLADLTGITAEPIDVVVTRWGGGLPQYGPGHLDLVDRAERAVAEVPGLALAGAALHGVGVPACIATATAAAARITSHLVP
ncbi:protoporphyrinogen oxidase [Amycolatopsis thermophila]|uniref:Coproporphyrinogen III oxidase n=1 Tax=Amycolatopsis thermophila TaxID=206084 RepID=A0ABU0EZG4_9PSEU|nr:protoporphyrinogen oxidase [Amycolatopsis thermophila]MDQ0380245.1 oxygen-dependent protoporphyrinogen oxidase [Amycolatopsis thermophila]